MLIVLWLWHKLKSANTLCVLIPSLFAIYYFHQSNLFAFHTGSMNHSILGLAFISTAYFASYKLGLSLIAYATFQFFVSIDYFLYPIENTLISNYYFVINNALNFWLIFSVIDGGYNDSTNSYRSAVVNPTRLVDLWNFQTHTEQGKRA